MGLGVVAMREPISPDMDRRTKQSPTTRRDEIRETAARLFVRHGYRGTTMRAIASEAGILKGSLYHYFESKQQLLDEIVMAPHATLLQHIAGSVGELDKPPLVAIDYFVRSHVITLRAHLSASANFYTDSRYLTLDARTKVLSIRRRYRQILQQLIRRGQEDGSIRSDIEPSMIAASILTMLNGLHQWYRPDGRRSIVDVADILASFAVSGLASRASQVNGRDS